MESQTQFPLRFVVRYLFKLIILWSLLSFVCRFVLDKLLRISPSPPSHSPTSLPQDLIVSEVLTRLPTSSLLQLRHVCKHWLNEMSNPAFASSHLLRQTPGRIRVRGRSLLEFSSNSQESSSLSYNIDLECVINERFFLLQNSCNGLVLLLSSDHTQRRFYIVNPVIRRYTKLTSTTFNRAFLHYDDILRQYMVFGWVTIDEDPHIYVLVLRKDRPKVWQEFSVPDVLSLLWFPPAVSDGWLYWLARKTESSDQNWRILGFNPRSGEFRLIRIPGDDKGGTIQRGFRLTVMNKSLCLIRSYWVCARSKRFYVVGHVEDYHNDDDFEKSIVNVYEDKVRGKLETWSFQYACTPMEANEMMDSYKSMQAQDAVHVNSLVWDINAETPP